MDDPLTFESAGVSRQPPPAPGMSVIMSVCDSDAEGPLKEALDSLLAQSCRDFEIVIAADCTKPALWQLLEEYAARHDFIRMIPTSERLTHGGALNLAMDNSRGEYLVHMDSDDISHPERLARIREFFRGHPDVDVVGSFIEEFGHGGFTCGVVQYPLRHEEIRKFILRRNPVAHGSVAQRSGVVARAGHYVRYSIRNEDTLYWLNALKAGVRFANIPEPLYRVRYAQGNNRRRTGFKKACSDCVDRLRIILDLDGSWTDVLYALAVCAVQNCPGWLYQTVRSCVVYRAEPGRARSVGNEQPL